MALEEALEHARRSGNHRLQTEALLLLSPSLFWGPMPLSEALPRAEAILESARGDKWFEGWALRPLIGFYGMLGRFDEAREFVARAYASLEELGRTVEASTLGFWSGPLERLAGDPVAAERAVASACETLEERGEKGWFSSMSGELAEALVAQDRLDEAEAAAARSRDAATSDDYNAQSMWRGAQAKILARRGQFEEAERLAQEAISVGDHTDELNNQAGYRMGLAEVLRLAGRADEAVPVLEEVLARYEQKGNVVMTGRARALLDEPSAAAPPGS